LSSQESEIGEQEEGSTVGDEQPMPMGGAVGPEMPMPTQAGPQPSGGRRAQLRVVRENIQSLSKDVWNFRKTHTAGNKKLEKQLTALRAELAAHARSKELVNLSKSYKANTKRLESQVAALRKELTSLKGNIARDAARSRAKQEATLSKILAKVSARASKPSKRAKRR
jgi:uncharacterized protein involved in exopolysaccharide biosynthesis